MTQLTDFGRYLPVMLCLLFALLSSPAVFSRLMPGELSGRETLLLWSVAACLSLLACLFLYYARNSRATARIWAILLGLGFAALMLEVGLRLIMKPGESLLMYQPAPGMANGFRLKPDLHLRTQVAQVPVSIHTSARGLRTGEVPKAEATGATKIAFLGDSFTFGLWAASSEKTFVSQSARLLGDVDYSVFNLGVPGYGIEDSLALLRFHWKWIDPDLVVLSFYNGNDFLDTYLGLDRYTVSPAGLLEYNTAVAVEKIPDNFRRASFRLESWLYEHFYLARGVSRFLSLASSDSAAVSGAAPTTLPQQPSYTSDAFWSQKTYPEFAQRAREITLDKLQELVEFVCDEQGRKLLIVSIPFQEQVVIPEQFTNQYSVKRPQAILETFSEVKGIPYLDLQPYLSRSFAEDRLPLYYYFDGHFNDLGHTLAAREIAGVIAGLLTQKTEPATD